MTPDNGLRDEVSSGYCHRTYAESLSEHGELVPLFRAGGWLLRRPIAQTGLHDAMGCYPLLCCSRWSQLGEDLARLDGLVSISAVADPLGDYSIEDLEGCFDGVDLYKQHYVVDLNVPFGERLNSHHRRETRRAAKAVSVERCAAPLERLEEWALLYQSLVRRHGIRGIAAFSRRAFASQFAVPGLLAYRAKTRNGPCGMALWYVDGERAYYHLAACTEAGYRNGAAYALLATALDDLAAEGLRWASLGAAAGIRPNSADGLARFKAGWSTGTRSTFFCSRILDREAYRRLMKGVARERATYFPAYRADEASWSEEAKS